MNIIVLHIADEKFVSDVDVIARQHGMHAEGVVSQNTLFEHINDKNSCALVIIDDNLDYVQRAINTFRNVHPNSPAIVMKSQTSLSFLSYDGIDLMMLCSDNPKTDASMLERFICDQKKLYKRIEMSLPPKTNDVCFGDGYVYDSTYRTVSFRGNVIKRLPLKEGRILEMFARNYGTVIKREFILDSVWHSTDIFTSRSFDVYVTKLRNFFRENEIDLKIKNITGVGLVLE